MSTNLPLFDTLFSPAGIAKPRQFSGSDLRDSGIQSALEHVLKVKAEYVERCLAEIAKLPLGATLTSEDLRELAGEPPQDCENSIAGILKRAKGKKLIENTGEEVVAKRTTIHAKKLCVWRRL